MSNLFSLSYSNKKNPANLWDEKTIAFIILSLDEARHIFVTKIAGSICPQRLACVKKSIWVANSTRYSVSFSQVFGTHRGGGYTPIYMTTNFWINTNHSIQDGGRRSAGGSVPKLEYDILRRNASTNVRKTYLIERYILHWKPKHTVYVRYFSILFVFVVECPRCPDWK
jgi:hypothetical protein